MSVYFVALGGTQFKHRTVEDVTWDVTVSDTLAQSYVHETSQTPGAAAEAAAERKRNKYSSLSQSYLFVPIAAVTMGGPSAKTGWTFCANLEGASHNVQMTTVRAPSFFSDYPF